jgi:mRNA interferase MazF
MGQKDFQKWHAKKSVVNEVVKRVYFHEREIWWCALGANVGCEQDGHGNNFERPVLILKKFNKEVFWGIPLTTKIKIGSFYVPVHSDDRTSCVAIVLQLRLMDAKRLLDKMFVMDKGEYEQI